AGIGGRIGPLAGFGSLSETLADLVRNLEKHRTPPTLYFYSQWRSVRWERYLSSRPFGVLPLTPYSSDLLPKAAAAKPSAARPRFNNSRIAAAREGIRVLYRKSSNRISSSPVSMICNRSARLLPSAIPASLSKRHHMSIILIINHLIK